MSDIDDHHAGHQEGPDTMMHDAKGEEEQIPSSDPIKDQDTRNVGQEEDGDEEEEEDEDEDDEHHYKRLLASRFIDLDRISSEDEEEEQHEEQRHKRSLLSRFVDLDRISSEDEEVEEDEESGTDGYDIITESMWRRYVVLNGKRVAQDEHRSPEHIARDPSQR